MRELEREVAALDVVADLEGAAVEVEADEALLVGDVGADLGFFMMAVVVLVCCFDVLLLREQGV